MDRALVRAVVLDLESLNPQDLDLQPLRECLQDWQFHHHTEPDQVDERIGHAQIIVTNKVPITREHIQAAPELRLICVAATGTNNIDLDAANDAGVLVSNARNYATASVVEHVFSLLLTLVRHLDSYRQRVKAGDWSHSPNFCLFDESIEELSGKTLGIVGFGVLGQAVAQLAQAFSMRVQIAQRLYGPPLPERIPFEQLLEISDIVSLHCPLSAQTQGLINEPQLQRMKNTAILINTARGGIVDEQALVRALQQGWIAAAGVDVVTQEPPEASNSLLQYAAPQLIVTPHVAWASRAARQRLITEIVDNIEAFLHGRPRNT
ncbi:MAG: D-2-hydroxyacid dehydrogenase, partial [Pseudomonadota bacterium]|nr:D-2-hydroxyacid dehydrogenase [Pseudomonadota bacterium]